MAKKKAKRKSIVKSTTLKKVEGKKLPSNPSDAGMNLAENFVKNILEVGMTMALKRMEKMEIEFVSELRRVWKKYHKKGIPPHHMIGINRYIEHAFLEQLREDD